MLQDEFLNARGAIARFGRGSIEIRLLDIQECPQADIAICALVTEVLKLIVQETWSTYKEQRLMVTKDLFHILLECIEHGSSSFVANNAFLHHFGLEDAGELEAIEIWSHLLQCVVDANGSDWKRKFAGPIQHILEHDNLASRIIGETTAFPTQADIREIYRGLADCLAEGRLFGG